MIWSEVIWRFGGENYDCIPEKKGLKLPWKDVFEINKDYYISKWRLEIRLKIKRFPNI